MRQSFIFSTYFKRVITRVQHEVDELLKATQTETQEDLVRRMKTIIPEFLVLET